MTTIPQLILQVLQESYQVMQDPSRVTTGAFARNPSVDPQAEVEIFGPEAECYCSVGIIHYRSRVIAQGDKALEDEIVWEAKTHLHNALQGFDAIVWFHDATAVKDRPLFLDTWRRAVDAAQAAL